MVQYMTCSHTLERAKRKLLTKLLVTILFYNKKVLLSIKYLVWCFGDQVSHKKSFTSKFWLGNRASRVELVGLEFSGVEFEGNFTL